MKIKCPKCNETIEINISGRPRKDVDFTIVCKALQDGKGNYSRAARLIEKETGIKVTPGFVQIRIQRSPFSKEEILQEVSISG